MESILILDRLRQNVAVKELETAHGQPLSMRKTVSVPNFSQVCDAAQRLLQKLCFLVPFVLTPRHPTTASKIIFVQLKYLTKNAILSLFTISMRFHQTIK